MAMADVLAVPGFPAPAARCQGVDLYDWPGCKQAIRAAHPSLKLTDPK
jgi:hypothetical protein